MIRDKRRHEAPEDRRDYQDKLNKREERAQQSQLSWLEKVKEDPSIIHGGRSPGKSAFEAISAAMGVKQELVAFASKISKYVYMDEWAVSSPGNYLTDDTWPGYKPEPEGLTGKAKKRWHHVQFKAHKAWVESERRREAEERQREVEIAQLEELAEETVLAESRQDLGWGGF